VNLLSDRKYRHRGYQDSGGYGSGSSGGSQSQRPSGPTPELRGPRLEGAPRGRTAGGFGPEAFKCNRCGELCHNLTDMTFDDVCMKCNSDLHTCGNCRSFDTTTTWECRENIPARIAAKHGKNQCTFFQPKIVRDLAADKRQQLQSPDDARKAFDALFKK
jgi:hypothetical protein